MLSKKDCFDSFCSGAFDGLKCCYRMIPSLMLVVCLINAFTSSGLADIMCCLLKSLLEPFNVPKELLPAIVLRPFSGSAVTAVADKLFSEVGADSFVSKTACILMGTTDTIVYTLSLYFSGANIKKTRYAFPLSFIVFVFSVLLCSFVSEMFL